MHTKYKVSPKRSIKNIIKTVPKLPTFNNRSAMTFLPEFVLRQQRRNNDRAENTSQGETRKYLNLECKFYYYVCFFFIGQKIAPIERNDNNLLIPCR